jgi:hypothetical protein
MKGSEDKNDSKRNHYQSHGNLSLVGCLVSKIFVVL